MIDHTPQDEIYKFYNVQKLVESIRMPDGRLLAHTVEYIPHNTPIYRVLLDNKCIYYTLWPLDSENKYNDVRDHYDRYLQLGKRFFYCNSKC